MPLEPEDQRHVTAAQGYAELGLPIEADAEQTEADVVKAEVIEGDARGDGEANGAEPQRDGRHQVPGTSTT